MKRAPRSPLSLVVDNEPAAQVHPASEAVQMSFPNVFDPHRMRAEMPELWSAYLRSHYRTSVAVAHAFQVTHQTALNWLDGVSRPTGDKVMLEVMRHPDRLRAHAQDRFQRAA